MPKGGYRAKGYTSNLKNYLRRQYGIFSLQITANPMQPEIMGQTITAKDIADGMKRVQNTVGKELAESALKTMRKWLAPGGTYNIGVTGGAERNLYAKSVTARGQGRNGMQIVWGVYEGPAYVNRAIRRGVKSKRTKAARMFVNSQKSNAENAKARRGGAQGGAQTYVEGSLLGKLRAWAKAKGLHPKMHAPRLISKRQKAFWKHDNRNIGPGQATQVKPQQSNYLRERGMVWALYRSMLQHGTSKSYTKRFGKPYFDYPRLYTTGKNGVKGTAYSIAASKFNKGGRVYEELNTIFADYLYSNIKKHGRVTSSMGSRTVATE